jgi:DNA processing protein
MISPFGRAALALDLLPLGVRKWEFASLLEDATLMERMTQDVLDQVVSQLQLAPSSALTTELVKGALQSADEELRRLEALDGSIVTIFDGPALYPGRLRECYRGPLFMEVLGDPAAVLREAIAVVGTRKPTSEGTRTASDLAAQLAEAGLVITSGLAYGIDKAAHLGCLHAGGATVAVLGSGIDCIYPGIHEPLARDIAASAGAVVSEYHLGTQPTPYTFPQRNRIISGLSLGVLVVEAAKGSGSLLTAGFALEQNREVFAVPGSIYSNQHVGTNALIRNGAKLVQSVQDVLEELPSFAAKAQQQECAAVVSGLDQRLVVAVESGCTSVDSLCDALSVSPAHLLSTLTNLEIRGIVARVGPDKFVLVQKRRQ